jgi:hypothetical protein
MPFESEKRFLILELGIDNQIDAVAHRVDLGIRQDFKKVSVGNGGKLLQSPFDSLDILILPDAEENNVPDHAATT